MATPIVATRSIIRQSRAIHLASHAPTTNATPKKMNVVARSATRLLFDERRREERPDTGLRFPSGG